MMQSSNKNKFVARSLELRSLRSWFKHLPSICEFSNHLNSKYCSYLHDKDQSNIKESIQKYYIHQPFVSFYKRYILRNVFESWKTYVIYKLRKRKALCEADHIYRRNLKRNILNVLSRNIIKSNKYYKTTVKRRYFELWKKHTKIIRINKSLVERSTTFYIRTCLQKFITIWKAFVQHKREKNILQRNLVEKVSNLYNSKLLHKYFITWINMHNSTKVFKEQLRMVLYYYKKKMLNQYFLAWMEYCDMVKEKKDLQNKADQQYCRRLMKRSLKQFILYTNEVYVYKRKMKVACTFYESKIMIKVFEAWIKWYYQVKKIHNIIHKVQEIVEDKIKKRIFYHWKLYVHHKKLVRRKMTLCLIKYHKKISINAFVKLQDYVFYKKRKRTHILNLNNKTVIIITRIQSMYIDKWKKALNIHMQEKCETFRATEFYNNYISRRYLFNWKKFSQLYKIKLLQKKELNERASCFVLSKFIMLWKLKCEENYQIYEKEKLLVSIMHKRIQKKYFTFWEIYRNRKIEKRKDVEYAKTMNEKFSLQEGLREILRHSLFTIQFDHENKLKYAISKSVEDFEILNQYFARWLSLIHLKEKSEPLSSERISYGSHRDNAIPSKYTVSKSDEFNTLFINDTNNNLYYASLHNNESMSSLTNNVELLPPSAFD